MRAELPEGDPVAFPAAAPTGSSVAGREAGLAGTHQLGAGRVDGRAGLWGVTREDGPAVSQAVQREGPSGRPAAGKPGLGSLRHRVRRKA
jgi:hypothetical protein